LYVITSTVAVFGIVLDRFLVIRCCELCGRSTKNKYCFITAKNLEFPLVKVSCIDSAVVLLCCFIYLAL